MPTVGSNTGGGAAEMPRSMEPSPRRPSGLMLRRFVWSSLAVCLIAVLLLGIGFIWFVLRVPAEEVTLDRDADGIVALTGGASRIADAIELLASGRGKRLLISGAYRATDSNAISRLNPEFARWVRCCVDFDRSLNTLGNAIETRRWAESRGFRSLIVVTSNYHMPRALAEIAHQLPKVALVPFPVVTQRQRAEPWWVGGTSARLMITEYVKYVFAKLRIYVGLHPARTANAAS
ncbi:MAG TPA: YdcF family protein [Xanthobacteraceae bacterium]|jgi:uncharacterized SAM-binding protein YcdF (DUF218 family)